MRCAKAWPMPAASCWALTGWMLGRWLGFDFIGTEGYGAQAMVGLVFIVLGCGAGKWLARRWLAPPRAD